MQSVSLALCKAFKKAGLSIFANQDYMSRIRGGNNFSQLRICDKPIYAPRNSSDILVALDKPSVSIHSQNLSSEAVIILDKNKFSISEENNKFFDVPFYEMANKIGGSDIFINSVCCGLLAGLIRLDLSFIESALKEIFQDKGEELIRKNIEAARAGYEFAKNNFSSDKFLLKPGNARNSLLFSANEAIALGAIKAGCKFYSAYPMSPSTNIMNLLAGYAKDYQLMVEQAEDEIAAINMIIGASFAGVRSMLATSGGGFSLMVEGLSLAGMTETPIVAVDAQRPAPATGFPTRTEQADLDFLIHAGHGEFARAIFSPGTAEEAFYLTVKAFNLAEKYQIPVLIMTDQYLSESYRDVDMIDTDKIKVERYVISKEDSKKVSNYKRYQLTESGISPLAVPSWIEDVIYADSDEHTEEGHISEDAQVRVKMVEKRFHKKMAGLSKEIEPPTAEGTDNAETILIGFGSTFGVMKEACERLKDKNIGFIHLPQVWPFPSEQITKLLKGAKKTLTVENNAAGQLARLIRRETGIKINDSILKFDGRPFSLDILIERLEKD